MAHLHRLIALFMLMVCGHAFALTCTAPQVPVPNAALIAATQAAYASTMANCVAQESPSGPAHQWSKCTMVVVDAPPGVSPLECRNQYPGNGQSCVAIKLSMHGGGEGWYASDVVDYICGTPTPSNAAQCQALSGQTFNSIRFKDGAGRQFGKNPSPMCDAPANGDGSGCTVEGTRDMSYQLESGEWVTQLTGVKYTGAACTITPGGQDSLPTTNPGTSTVASTGTAAPYLPPGKCPGTVNGVEVVVNCGKSSETKSTTSTSSTTTSTTAGTSTTPTIEREVSVECSGSTCTKTVVTKTTDGGIVTTKTETTSGGKGAVCAGEQLSTCGTSGNGNGAGGGDGDGSSFGGTCVTNFTCDGDAAMCAIAKATNKTNCMFVPDPTASDSLAAATATAGFKTETFALGQDAFDTSDALGGAACVPDVNITVWGKQVALPVSTVCPTLAIMGNVLLFISFLVAIKIVSGR